MKPLGIKNYGSIPHLPGSRMGPADHHCHEGQERICLTKVRDRHDLIILQEKLDGSNVGVAKHEGRIIALTRAGYEAGTSPYEQHHKFEQWVFERERMFEKLLHEGERLVGEWMAQAHGTRYLLRHEPFVVFDLMEGSKRALYRDLFARVNGILPLPYTPHIGGAVSIDRAMDLLGPMGNHGAMDEIEGAVWRVERNGAVDFLAKYVRPTKVDGCYLESVTGASTVWNDAA